MAVLVEYLWTECIKRVYCRRFRPILLQGGFSMDVSLGLVYTIGILTIILAFVFAVYLTI